jgi:hypothetical protein
MCNVSKHKQTPGTCAEGTYPPLYFFPNFEILNFSFFLAYTLYVFLFWHNSYFSINILILNLLNQYFKCQPSCIKIYKRMRTIKADFHSVQNVTRSTFCDHFLLKYKQSNTTDQVDWTHFKRKWSQTVDLAIFCTEWKSATLRFWGMQHVRTAYLFLLF